MILLVPEVVTRLEALWLVDSQLKPAERIDVACMVGTDDVNDKFTAKMTQTERTLAVGCSVVNAI